MGFNTQPPEGGWLPIPSGQALRRSFNTQPPEGGWLFYSKKNLVCIVSTHSRPKAAGVEKTCKKIEEIWFQHTAARRRLDLPGCFSYGDTIVSTHSRPKAAGKARQCIFKATRCFNTQPPEGGWDLIFVGLFLIPCFNTQPPEGGWRQ